MLNSVYAIPKTFQYIFILEIKDGWVRDNPDSSFFTPLIQKRPITCTLIIKSIDPPSSRSRSSRPKKTEKHVIFTALLER